MSGNTVSCIIELKTMWFNFAAPPRTPITRKIDYTRLDWNLLSTASPAINAWMNPSNRFAIQVINMFRCMYRRSTAVVACLMAEALDIQGIHMPKKVCSEFFLSSFFFLFILYMLLFIENSSEPVWKTNAISENSTGGSILSVVQCFAELCSTV